jgi:hypothetical protein
MGIERSKAVPICWQVLSGQFGKATQRHIAHLFKAFKTAGFNLEQTHLTEAKK